MKKLLSLILCIGISTFMTANAEEKTETSVFNDALKNMSVELNTEDGVMKKDGDGYVFENADAGVAYFGEMGSIVEIDASFNLKDAEWVGFELYSKEKDKRCYTNNTTYVAIVRATGVEIQSFNQQGLTGFLASYIVEIPQNEKMNVKTGVIPTEKGNYVFIKLGDIMFGAYDETASINNGNFCLEGRLSGITVYETTPVEEIIPTFDVQYVAKENVMQAELTGIGEETPVYSWYLSDAVLDEKTLLADMTEYEYIDGVVTEKFMAQNNEIGQYGLCIAEVGGKKIYSPVCYVDPVEYVYNNGFVARVGYSNGITLGENFYYNETEELYVDEIDGYVYIPYRGAAEAYGCEVSWNDDTRTVSTVAPIGSGHSPEVEFCVDELGFLKFKNLMGSTMVRKPLLIKDRTYLDMQTVASILAFDNVTYDEATGIVIMSKPKIELSEKQLLAIGYDLDI